MPPKSEAKNIQAYEPFRVVISERLFIDLAIISHYQLCQ